MTACKLVEDIAKFHFILWFGFRFFTFFSGDKDRDRAVNLLIKKDIYKNDQ
jgi:hypothetical protein